MLGFSINTNLYEEKNRESHKQEIHYKELLVKLEEKLSRAKKNKNHDEIKIVEILINKIKSR